MNSPSVDRSGAVQLVRTRFLTRGVEGTRRQFVYIK
jgi:hypothetical protein